MRFFPGFILIFCVTCALAQQDNSQATPPAPSSSTQPSSGGQNQPQTSPAPPDASQPSGEQQNQPPSQSAQPGAPGAANAPNSTQPAPPNADKPSGEQQSQPPSQPAQPDVSVAPNAPSPPASPRPVPAVPPLTSAAAKPETPVAKKQPKRILGVMPNYRAVSAGEAPPPPTAKQAFKLATVSSFDYSSFLFVGFTSAIAEGTDAHPQLGKGMAGFGRYYWRGFLDKADGNYLVIFALPTLFRQDERFYAMGEGGFWKRTTYSATRIFITPDYHGHNSVNFSELLGRGMAQGISLTYYPSHDRTAGALAAKYGYALGRDALTNVFREFWPDISTHVLHRHP